MIKMNVNLKNPFVKKVLGIIQHYDEKTYWKLREKIIKKSGGVDCFYGIFFASNEWTLSIMQALA